MKGIVKRGRLLTRKCTGGYGGGCGNSQGWDGGRKMCNEEKKGIRD